MNEEFSRSDDRSLPPPADAPKAHALSGLYKNLSFGFVLTAPSLHLFGSAQESANFSRADGMSSTAVPTRSTGSSEVGPLRAGLRLWLRMQKRRYTFPRFFGGLAQGLGVRYAYNMTGQAIVGPPAPSPVRDVDDRPGSKPT